jgi:uncharacterized membrane protein
MNSPLVRRQKFSIGKAIGWAFLLLFAIFPVLVSTSYLTLNPESFPFADQRATYTAHLTMLMMHIIGAMLAILIGPFQFLPGIRKGRWLKVHRWLGRTYLISVLVGGLGGLYMAQFSYGGMVTHLGFGALACLWLYTAYRAYHHIRNKEIEQHRQWMIRNYALTFAGVMLRIYLPLSGAMGIDFLTAYRAISWLAWVLNLLVAEWIIRRTLPARRRAMVLARRETPRPAQTEV